MGFAATSLGVARAHLDAAIDLARKKTPQGLSAMQENNAVQGLIGRTEANLRARPRLSVRDRRRGLARPLARRRLCRSASHCDAAGRDLDHPSIDSVVDTAYHMAGATAVFPANQFERRLPRHARHRQQIQARDTHYEDVGKAILSANLDAAPRRRGR